MGHSHYTDHLAAVCVMMDIPLLFADTGHAAQARALYPDLRAKLHSWHEFTPEVIADQYNVLFVSDMWSQEQIQKRFGSRCPHIVHCPHGFSDKGFWFAQCINQQLTLVYGQNMLDLITHSYPDAAWKRYVVTGNLRYTYYKQHQEKLDRYVEKQVLAQFVQKQTTLLYAPTWRDQERSSSFFAAADTLLTQLPDHYNLIVKLHPNLEQDQDFMVDVYAIISRYELKPNVLFLTDFPLIYPLLAACDIYIGDRSAIGYDFLAFNRPMFFLNHVKQSAYLFRCGTVVGPEDFACFFTRMQEALAQDKARYSAVRKQVYNYTFAPQRFFPKIRKQVLQALNLCTCSGKPHAPA